MVSMKEIAAACGVSVATVSKALSNHSDIAEKTKERIKETANRMGYFPNQSARYLKTNRSYNIGVLLQDAGGSGLTHDYFSGILESFRSVAEKKGYDVTFLNTSSREMTYEERAKYRGFDGLVIACMDYYSPDIRKLLQSDLKMITIDYIADNRTAVISDNMSGMHVLMEYVIQQGHEKIAYIHGDDTRVTKQRLAVYHRMMQEHGFEIPDGYLKASEYRDIDLAYKRTEELLDREDPPTCIMYPDDIACFGGINAIRARGLRIPEDISVTGYDGIRAAQYGEPRLATFYQDVKTIGRLAAESLIEEIEQPMLSAPAIHNVTGNLIEGQSVGRVKATE